MQGQSYHVFISYAHADADWVEVLALNLRRAALTVFLDKWEIGPGDRVAHCIDEGIAHSEVGVLVVSPAWRKQSWVQAEYEAVMQRTIEGSQRIIPVLYQDAEVPPLLARYVWVDFRHAEGPNYVDCVASLVRALRGVPPGLPRGDAAGGMLPQPDGMLRPSGTHRITLELSPTQVTLRGDEAERQLLDDRTEVSHVPAGLGIATRQRISELWAEYRRRMPEHTHLHRPARAPGASASTELESRLLEAGAALTNAFLDGAAGQALRRAIERTTTWGSVLELALDVSNDLKDRPWEALRLPPQGGGQCGGPLVLHPSVRLCRRSDRTSAPAHQISGPLRILVVIASPEALNARGELLDMERELGLILNAVDPARRRGQAYLRILETGSIESIHKALEERRYHVLHISCHAAPGELLLEDERGRERWVRAQQLCEAIPAGRAVPLVVLAGCQTALGETPSWRPSRLTERETPESLTSLARELLEHGAPAVLAMQAPVGDMYASLLCARLYEALATHQLTEPLAALSFARRAVEEERCKPSSLGTEDLAQWATPELFLRGPSCPLYDPHQQFETLSETPQPLFDHGVVVRRVADFVGRRRERRQLRQSLREARYAGSLLHGIGGVGKSALAVQVSHDLAQDEWLLASVAGEIDPDGIFAAIGARLSALADRLDREPNHPWRKVSERVRNPKLDWSERLDDLRGLDLPLLVLFDNFEDNLTSVLESPAGPSPALRSNELALLLSRWLSEPGVTRLLFTCRYPFALPHNKERCLWPLHLGPLSAAEMRKLVWRLPGLDALSPSDLVRAHHAVGGHPRALEYLDALLRGEQARFRDVEDRLLAALRQRGIHDPEDWCRQQDGGLDRALAETVTLIADDVLLDALLSRIKESPLARRLLDAASVYRIPVEAAGLWCQLEESVETYSDEAPSEYRHAREQLDALSLLCPVHLTEDSPTTYYVHRWTAGALERRCDPSRLFVAHKVAARYFVSRADQANRPRELEVNDLLEARYHHHFAGEIDTAAEITERLSKYLHTSGAWQREDELCRETLGWVEEGGRQAATFQQRIGHVARERGDYDEALHWYQQSLEIREAICDRAGVAASLHSLGNVAFFRGDYEQALRWYHPSLEIKVELNDRAGMAISYHQLGWVAQERGKYDEALRWYHHSLEIFEELGDSVGMSASYHHLGWVAQERGEYDEALRWYRHSLKISEKLGDRVGIALIYHQLGMIAEARGEYDEALRLYRQSLEISEDLGDRADVAKTYHHLGTIAQVRGEYDEAQRWHYKSLKIAEEIGNRAGIAYSHNQLGLLAKASGDHDEAIRKFEHALVTFQDLGKYPEVAETMSHIGELQTERGQPDQGLVWNLKSYAIRRELKNSAQQANLELFGLQCAVLGADEFARIVRAESATEEQAAAVLGLLG